MANGKPGPLSNNVRYWLVKNDETGHTVVSHGNNATSTAILNALGARSASDVTAYGWTGNFLEGLIAGIDHLNVSVDQIPTSYKPKKGTDIMGLNFDVLTSRWTALRWIAVAAMVLAAVAYLVAVPFGAIPHEDRLATAEVVLSVALIAGFAFFGSLSQVDITSTGVSIKVRDLVRRQDVLQAELDVFRQDVVQLFLNTMAPSMYEQLLKLQHGDFRGYEKTPDFQREMTNLRDAGYVADFNWNDIPDKEANADLSTYITITSPGREFLRLRAQLAKEAGRE